MWVFKFLVILIFLASQSAVGVILNRNLLEVDRQVYTQRDFEIYILSKEALFLKKGIAPVLVKSETWNLLLETYKNEMLINGLFNKDAQRLIGFLPNGDMIKASYAIVSKSLKISNELKRRYQHLKVVNSEVKSQLIQILKVQNYLKSKANKLTQTRWFYQLDTTAPWFNKVTANMPYRFFVEANKFKELQGLQ